ncbi:tyrosine-type recombinase/integrase, partial [Paracoccus sp. MC1862]|uniref:tyrosine-type recombinase/integrase n=1 Tax=Paracoccus sp. MC1862 TaxID=2760307 RepID=UPI0016010D91
VQKSHVDHSITPAALRFGEGSHGSVLSGNYAPTRVSSGWKSTRIDSVWTLEDERRFLDTAPSHIGLAFMLAIWTGQRQGDLLRLKWSAYDGKEIRLRQSKTSARVTITVGEPLRLILDNTERTTETILATSRQTPWTESGFRSSWRTACEAAGIDGLTFHDLRGTAVTRLAVAGATTPEIGTITGHSLKQVEAILDSHYLSRDSALGLSAIRKREIYEGAIKTPN